jgi:hypothetical protein
MPYKLGRQCDSTKSKIVTDDLLDNECVILENASFPRFDCG